MPTCSCNHICKDIAADLTHINRNIGLYKQGFCWCTICQKYFTRNRNYRCLCCNNKLRMNSNYTDAEKQKYILNKNNKKIKIKIYQNIFGFGKVQW